MGLDKKQVFVTTIVAGLIGVGISFVTNSSLA